MKCSVSYVLARYGLWDNKEKVVNQGNDLPPNFAKLEAFENWSQLRKFERLAFSPAGRLVYLSFAYISQYQDAVKENDQSFLPLLAYFFITSQICIQATQGPYSTSSRVLFFV